MKRNLITLSIILSSFLFGFTCKSILSNAEIEQTNIKKVTGIGGIFFKCKNPKAVNEWYQKNLGLDVSAYGASFAWREEEDSSKKGLTQWNTFASKSTYFAPSTKDFMINYRVANLETLVAALQKENVTIVDKMEVFDYGKFIHIMDIEGNKIQLWEPID
jgi:predicted enzyme related to lactoylglutathione lyase